MERLTELGERLCDVPGVRGVMLGGSRARGDARPDSDFDLGLYYVAPLDVMRLAQLAREVSGPAAQVTEPREWGPWVDGGGWLNIDGTPVDWLYRDLDRVERAWHDAQEGRYYFHGQIGHPLGVPDFAYAGEVALGVVLADPTGKLTELKKEMATYPPRLAENVVTNSLWEGRFLIDGARKVAQRGDVAWIVGCLFRVVELCAHALHAQAGIWLVNEKGAIASAGRLAVAPPGFASRAHAVVAHVGTRPDELSAALDLAEDLLASTSTACGRPA